MTQSMMRINSAVVERIKLLKSITSSSGSLQAIVDELVCNELKKTHINTEHGYIGVGSVVADPYGHVHVVTGITVDKVTFRDGSYIINGGKVSRELKLIAKDVSKYEGGIVNE